MGTALAKNDYQTTFEDLARKKKELEKLNRRIIEKLDMNPGFLHKTLQKIPFLGKFADKMVDPMSIVEHDLKAFINAMQGSLINLQEIAENERDKILELKQALKQAVDEEWGFEEIRRYIIEKANIKIDDRIQKLMDMEIEFTDEKDIEEKRKNLLEIMQANISTGEELLGLIMQVVFNSLSIFEGAINQYYSFTAIAEPMKIINQSAKTLVNGTKGAYQAKELILSILKTSIDAIDSASEAAKLTDQYRLNDSTMVQALKTARHQLERTMDLKVSGLHSPKKEVALSLPAPMNMK